MQSPGREPSMEDILASIKKVIAEEKEMRASPPPAEAIDEEPRPEETRVILVGASSGGVGSGTLVDLPFAIRTLFSELGRHDVEVLGVLGHWTPRESDQQLLAIANTLGEVKTGLEQIASSANQAEQLAGQASTAAREQAQGAEELAAAVEEIAALADELQNNA